MPQTHAAAVPDDLEKRFGDELRRLRKKRGLSQEALAHACGRHRTYVSLLERGKKSPTLRTLFMIASALDIPPTGLISKLR
jgi:transcriptional regulator with XRE-family HTH domain